MPQIHVHCDDELYRKAAERARAEGRSLSNLARRALYLYLEGLLVEQFVPKGTDTLSTPPPSIEPKDVRDPPGLRTTVGG